MRRNALRLLRPTRACADEQVAEILLNLADFTETELASIQKSIRRVQKKRGA
jgi:hypothetical protein